MVSIKKILKDIEKGENQEIYESSIARKNLKNLFFSPQDIFPFKYNERLKKYNMHIDDVLIL